MLCPITVQLVVAFRVLCTREEFIRGLFARTYSYLSCVPRVGLLLEPQLSLPLKKHNTWAP